MRAPSSREHVLMISALMIATITFVLVADYRPHRKSMRRIETQKELLERQLEQVQWPKAKGDPKRLAQRRDALRGEVEQARADLAEAEAAFASQGDPDADDELRIEMSALADRHEVRICEAVRCAAPMLRTLLSETRARSDAAPAERFVRFLALGEPYSFRARQLTLEADFAGLCAFLRGLGELRYRVLVIRFEITVVDSYRTRGAPLQAKLVVVS